MMFSHLDFYDRIGAVKKCGIDTVEFWKWTNKDIDKVKNMLDVTPCSCGIKGR